MQASEVKAFFEELIDDTWDEDSTYSLMQIEEQKIEMERDWMKLRTLDTSITISTGNTWQTAHLLPLDFLSSRKVQLSDGACKRLIEIMQEEVLQYQYRNGYYYIDYSDMTIHFTGNFTNSYTVYLFYKKTIVPDASPFTSTSTITWIPGKSGLVLAFRMAAHHKAGIDADILNFEMSTEQRQQYKEMMNALIQWDTKLQLKAMGN